MNARAPLQADREQIERFVGALFRYADADTCASVRAFYEVGEKTFRIVPIPLQGGTEELAATACRIADDAARASEPVVFCPPIATFHTPDSAREVDLANGLALSVECDSAPQTARQTLEALLGPATVVVASGGEWVDPDSGEIQPKLHLHWRLNEPTREPVDHARLKRLRTLAARLAGGDPTNTPSVHPIRWPGSWHRKGSPRLTRITSLDETSEIDLHGALEQLQEAAGSWNDDSASGSTSSPGSEEPGTGEERGMATLVAAILTGSDYHAPLVALAMRHLKAGMPDAHVVATLRGHMLAVPEALRDLKDGTPQPGRWLSRYNDIPRTVRTAREKLGPTRTEAADGETPTDDWPEPIDFLGEVEFTGDTELRSDHLPSVLYDFAIDTAARMGVDPVSVALGCLVSCAAVIPDAWRIQPKASDYTWTENPRLWAAVVGDPSILKSPVIKACTAPIDALDAGEREQHGAAMHTYRRQHALWKKEGSDPETEPAMPRLGRYLVESTTIEALTEVLRGDADAKQRALSAKVLSRQDEMGEFFANLDRYRTGGRGGGDRGAYLRLYNGGRYTVDRISRGSFSCPNWSACFLGGIQPAPIQRIARETDDDGLLQRFMYCVPLGPRDGQDRPPNGRALHRYHELIQRLAALHPPSGEARAVVLHAEAHNHRHAIDAMAKAISALPDSSTRLKSALGKWPGLFARLCLTLHLIEAADARGEGEDGLPLSVVSVRSAAMVAALMREILLPHLLRAETLLFDTQQTGHARWIAGFILQRGEPRITARDVVQAYGALRAPEDRRALADVMDGLVTVGWIRPEEGRNPARPPAAWQVNPKVHTLFAERAHRERDRRARARESVADSVRRQRDAR